MCVQLVKMSITLILFINLTIGVHFSIRFPRLYFYIIIHRFESPDRNYHARIIVLGTLPPPRLLYNIII